MITAIDIEPTSIAIRFERRDNVMVAVSEQPVSLLQKEEVEKTLSLLRNDRAS